MEQQINLSQNIEYHHITAGVYLHPEELQITSDRQMIWNPHFMERHNDYMSYFNMVLLNALLEGVGSEGWGIQFVQVSQETGLWFVDMYLDDKAMEEPIKATITKLIPQEFVLQFWIRGGLRDYLKH